MPPRYAARAALTTRPPLTDELPPDNAITALDRPVFDLEHLARRARPRHSEEPRWVPLAVGGLGVLAFAAGLVSTLAVLG